MPASKKAVELGEQDELVELKKKLFKKDGEPKANASAANMARYMALNHKHGTAEDPPRPLRKEAAAGSLRQWWQTHRRARLLLDQDLNTRGGEGLTDADREESRALIDRFKGRKES